MNEPKRLSAISDDLLERRLLGAGRASAPRAARERALAAATAAVATTGLATGSAAAGTTLAKIGSATALKWIAIVSVLGAGAAAGGVMHERAKVTKGTAVSVAALPALPAVAPSGIASAAGAVLVTEPVASSALAPPPLSSSTLPPHSAAPGSSAPSDAVPLEPAPSAPRRPGAPAEASSGSTVHEEIAWLDGARAAIVAGHPARGLSMLDGYAARFPRGSMAPEATVLRIEALIAAGDRDAAQRAADAFLVANPRSPYASRIQSLLTGANP